MLKQGLGLGRKVMRAGPARMLPPRVQRLLYHCNPPLLLLYYCCTIATLLAALPLQPSLAAAAQLDPLLKGRVAAPQAPWHTHTACAPRKTCTCAQQRGSAPSPQSILPKGSVSEPQAPWQSHTAYTPGNLPPVLSKVMVSHPQSHTAYTPGNLPPVLSKVMVSYPRAPLLFQSPNFPVPLFANLDARSCLQLKTNLPPIIIHTHTNTP